MPCRTALILAMLLAASAARADAPRVQMAGTLILPDDVPDADGTPVPLIGASGLTWLGDTTWAAILDNSDRFITFTLTLSDNGTPLEIENLIALKISARHDYEDIAPCPPMLASRIARRLERRGLPDPGTCLLVCEENTPAIRGMALADGRLLGAVPIPDILKTRRPNRGLEALSVDADGGLIWTANEEALPADGPPPTANTGTVVRLVAIPIPAGTATNHAATNEGGNEGGRNGVNGAANDAASPRGRQVAYAVDPPHEFARLMKGDALSGVVALVALGEGRLLVLERSGGPGLPPFENRLYAVDTANAADVAAIAGDLAARPDMHVAKRLLWKDSLGLNLEGLALGPKLPDGSRALLAIADNGGLGTPTRIVAFRLTE